MAHKGWCGKSCADCQNPCGLDKALYCSPDCENLSPNGETDPVKCGGCDCYCEAILMDILEKEE